jgi:hypothetical protein
MVVISCGCGVTCGVVLLALESCALVDDIVHLECREPFW